MAETTPFLRPPGALSEKDFLARCILCGQCAELCNFDCIILDKGSLPSGTNTPKIHPEKAPCFLCMKCSKACPTHALTDVPMDQASMGKAYLDGIKCVNYQEETGIMCWTCYERCPLRGTAIILKNGYTATVTDACVGCGVCLYVCPTKAITVTPARSSKKTSKKE